MNSKGLLILTAITLTGLAGCTVYYEPGDDSTVESAPQPVVIQESQVPQLQQLVAPIALYPDPLLADILPASTYPQQIQQASQWAMYNPGAPQAYIDAQPWAPSVKALVHYPSVLAYMNNDIGWTQSLGAAFITEEPYVMAAIQDLRQQAYTVGNLYSTPQQVVVVDGGYVYIQPASPAFVCVPTYDPVVVYSARVTIIYGTPYPTGVWFTHAFDWNHQTIYVVNDWRAGWVYGGDGWHRDAGYRWDQDHSWARDDKRWGAPPRVQPEHYEVRQDMRGRNFTPVRATHVEEVRHEPARQPARNNNGAGERDKPKPIEKPVNPPAPKPVDHPVNKPGEKPTPKPIDRPGEKPGDKPGDKPGGKPGDKPGDKPGGRPGENSGDKSGNKPADKPGDKAGDKPGARPGDNSGDKSGNKPDGKPGDKPGAKPGDKPGDKPAAKPDPKPEPKPQPKPDPKPDPKPAPKPDPKPAPQPDHQPDPKPGDKPGQNPAPPKDDGRSR